MNNEKPKLQTIHGEVYASSLEISERFGIAHKNVLQSIEKRLDRLKSQPINSDFASQHFVESSYKDAKNRSQKSYLLTEEGFYMTTFLFQSDDALREQIRFINEFMRMKAALHENELDKIRWRYADQQLLMSGIIRENMPVSYAAHWLRLKAGLDMSAPRLSQMVRDGKIDGRFIPRKSIVYNDSLRDYLDGLGVLTPELAREIGV